MKARQLPRRGGLSRRVRSALYATLLLAGAMLAFAPVRAQPAQHLLLVPIQGTIDGGMAHMVGRAVDQARATHASAIVLQVNTFGGLVQSATEIRDALREAHIPVLAYVGQRAWSAGALITLSADKIAMAPAASIGDAEPIPKTEKTVSALRGEFESLAVEHHRDRRIAAAMVDATTDLPGYKAPGSILTLTSDQAVRAHVADVVAPDLASALRDWGYGNVTLADATYTWGEQLARFATDPQVSGLLLTIGLLGLLIEMQTLHGIAGLVGVGALALFFGTHVYAGFSNTLVLALAILGLAAILIELHVFPGHGVSGAIGLLALTAAILLAFGPAALFVGAQALSVAIVLSVLFFWASTRILPESAFMARLTLHEAQGPEYVASADFKPLVGHSGVAASLLRPAGVAAIEGRRVDVLTEGEFISAGTPVEVTRVEGARIFVRPIERPALKGDA